MIVGFTGTREGMTDGQCGYLEHVLRELKCTEFHHGDCIGADSQAAYLVRSMGGIKIVCHPPINPKLRANVPLREGDVMLSRRPYKIRNQAIVHACEHLCAGVRRNVEEPTGGTWYTIRYAEACGRPITIIER